MNKILKPPRVEMRGLSKQYGRPNNGTLALSDIELLVYKNEFFCILGESGCGKSTLLQLIAGFESPTSGEAFVDGERITGPSYKRAVVFQDPSLLPWLTVKKNIGLGLRLRRDRTSVEGKLEWRA